MYLKMHLDLKQTLSSKVYLFIIYNTNSSVLREGNRKIIMKGQDMEFSGTKSMFWLQFLVNKHGLVLSSGAVVSTVRSEAETQF